MEKKAKSSYLTGKTILEKLLAVEIFNQEDVLGNKKKMTIAELMHVRMVKKALDGDLKAYAEILDRLEGKSVQKVEEDVSHSFVSKPLGELIQFTKPTKTLNDDNEVVDLRESEDNVFRLDIDNFEAPSDIDSEQDSYDQD